MSWKNAIVGTITDVLYANYTGFLIGVGAVAATYTYNHGQELISQAKEMMSRKLAKDSETAPQTKAEPSAT